MVLVQPQPRARSEHERADRGPPPGDRERQRDGSVDVDLAERPGRHAEDPGVALPQAAHGDRRRGRDGLPDPGLDLLAQRADGHDAVTGLGPQRDTVPAQDVGEGDGQVLRVVGEHAERRGTRLQRAAAARPGHRPEPLQHREPPGGEHLVGGLDGGVEDRHQGAGVVADRAVAEGEPGLLLEPVTGHRQGHVLVVGGSARQRALHERLDGGPDVGPHLGHRAAERVGVPPPEDRGVPVVVEHDELRSDHEQHGDARGQARGRRRQQGGRPLLDRTGGGRRPVGGENAPVHLGERLHREQTRQIAVRHAHPQRSRPPGLPSLPVAR